MKEFNAAWVYLIGQRFRFKLMQYHPQYELKPDELEDTKTIFSPSMEETFKKYEFSSALASYSAVVYFFAQYKGAVVGEQIRIQFEKMLTGLLHDLQREKFFHMPASHVPRYNQKEPFGSTVNTSFPSAIFDAQEAGNCFAFGRYTASVYHSMRVLEHGLNAFLKAFPTLTPRSPNWGDILSEIEKLVTALPRTDSKREEYLGLIVDFKIFKDAWRNDVSHIGSKYEFEDADSIYQFVGRFMKRLATAGYRE
jgi:HEPN domain-containing protein